MTDPTQPMTPPPEIDPAPPLQPEIDPGGTPQEMPPMQPGENDGAPLQPQHGHGPALT